MLTYDSFQFSSLGGVVLRGAHVSTPIYYSSKSTPRGGRNRTKGSYACPTAEHFYTRQEEQEDLFICKDARHLVAWEREEGNLWIFDKIDIG